MTRKKADILLAFFLFLSLCSKAQYRYSALLDTVKSTGFYHIAITPELSSYLKTDLSDLSILDEKKQPVPYIIDSDQPVNSVCPMPFSIHLIRKETIGSKTIALIENTDRGLMSSFIIEIKNADAERSASLSGSDDNSNWFVVVDSFLLEKSTGENNHNHFQKIKFTACDYKYLKLTINNGNKEPLNVIAVSSPEFPFFLFIASPVFANPAPTFSQTDSAGYSLVKITNAQPFHMSRIQFTIKGPWLYKRPAKLFTEIKAGLDQTWNSRDHATMTISSDEFFGYSIPLLKAGTFYLLIKNGDNPPLKIATVSTEQMRRKVLTQLEAGVNYSLLMDNPEARPREYDLQHFRNVIIDSTAIIVGKITALPQTESSTPKKQLSNRWVWPAIILIVALLALLSWKLTSDMKKKGS
jgi:hypothetical protein